MAADLSAMLAAAHHAGVRGFGCCGTSPDDWAEVAALARVEATRVIPAYGVHPWYADEPASHWLSALEARLDADPSALVGEIGLDALRQDVEAAAQTAVFRSQLAVAVRYARPVVIHAVRAWGPLLEQLRPVAARLPGMLLHAFSGSLEVMTELVAMGAYCSFGGTVTRPQARRVRDAARAVPAARLLIETDTPDLLPTRGTPWRGDPVAGLNHPANLAVICAEVARLRGEQSEAVAALTWQNAGRLMQKELQHGSI